MAHALALAGVVVGFATPARAWYFPEHTELTRLALQDYAPAFVAETLTALIEEARDPQLGGLSRLCPGVTTRLDAAVDEQGRPCVPYGALAALAADHTNYAYELGNDLVIPWSAAPVIAPWRGLAGAYHRRELDPIAVSLTEAAQATWISFESSAPRELVEVWTGMGTRLGTSQPPLTRSVNPRNYVRSLDAALLILDPNYTSRARGAKTHFHDATESLADILGQSVAGDFDNALAQLLVHHLKSLQLAVQSQSATGRAYYALREQALFEHAFALHFIEDGLAGGHIATDPAVTVDELRAQRHDYFNRQGLAVRRSIMTRPCDPVEDQSPSPRYSMGLSPCWVAHGDGFATSMDRAYVAEAVARIQTSFVLALLPKDKVLDQLSADAPACMEWRQMRGKPQPGCDLAWTAFLLDPFPDWTRTRPRDEQADPAPWATAIVQLHREALATIAAKGTIRSANAGSALAQPHRLPEGIFGQALTVEEPSPGGAVSTDFGVRIVRPVLVAWPGAQSDVTTLAGSDVFHRGWQAQIAVNAAFSYANPLQRNAATSLWVGAGGGVGYAAQGIFPMRSNRTLFEANVGVAQGYYLAGSDVAFRSLGVIEVRAPVTTFALYGAAYLTRSRAPLELLGEKMSWGLLGARIYMTLGTHNPLLSGWDAEIANLYLGTPGSSNAALSGITASELRVRLGWRSPDFTRIDAMFDGVFFVALELSSGFYTTLL